MLRRSLWDGVRQALFFGAFLVFRAVPGASFGASFSPFGRLGPVFWPSFGLFGACFGPIYGCRESVRKSKRPRKPKMQFCLNETPFFVISRCLWTRKNRPRGRPKSAVLEGRNCGFANTKRQFSKVALVAAALRRGSKNKTKSIKIVRCQDRKRRF